MTVAILFRQLAAPASLLLGVMFLLWFLVLHVPLLAASPKNGNLWTSAFVPLATAGAAFVIAGGWRTGKSFPREEHERQVT